MTSTLTVETLEAVDENAARVTVLRPQHLHQTGTLGVWVVCNVLQNLLPFPGIVAVCDVQTYTHKIGVHLPRFPNRSHQDACPRRCAHRNLYREHLFPQWFPERLHLHLINQPT